MTCVDDIDVPGRFERQKAAGAFACCFHKSGSVAGKMSSTESTFRAVLVLGVLFLGVVLLAWTLRSLGVNLTDTVVTREAHTLITHGPYRWIRHPFYDALALFVVAFALIAANWFILVTGAIVFLLLAIRSQTEEALLSSRFGEPYRAYKEGTDRFLPRWHGKIRRG